MQNRGSNRRSPKPLSYPFILGEFGGLLRNQLERIVSAIVLSLLCPLLERVQEDRSSCCGHVSAETGSAGAVGRVVGVRLFSPPESVLNLSSSIYGWTWC